MLRSRINDVIAALAAAVLLAAPRALAANVHRVNVGQKGLTFDPSTVYAPAGDTVQFFFFPTNFSVVQGTPQAPCAPLNGGFFSGYVAAASGAADTSFAVTVTDSNPIFFYSSKGTDCEAGMVGVINPSGDNTLSAYLSGAVSLATATVGGSVSPPPAPYVTGGPVGGQLVSSGMPVAATGIQIGSAAPNASAAAASGSGTNGTAGGAGGAGLVTSFTDSAGNVQVTTVPGSGSGSGNANANATTSTQPPAAGGSGAGTATGMPSATGIAGGMAGQGSGAGGTAGTAGNSAGATATSRSSTGLAAPAAAAGHGEVLGVAGLIVGLVAGLV